MDGDAVLGAETLCAAYYSINTAAHQGAECTDHIYMLHNSAINDSLTLTCTWNRLARGSVVRWSSMNIYPIQPMTLTCWSSEPTSLVDLMIKSVRNPEFQLWLYRGAQLHKGSQGSSLASCFIDNICVRVSIPFTVRSSQRRSTKLVYRMNLTCLNINFINTTPVYRCGAHVYLNIHISTGCPTV